LIRIASCNIKLSVLLLQFRENEWYVYVLVLPTLRLHVYALI